MEELTSSTKFLPFAYRAIDDYLARGSVPEISPDELAEACAAAINRDHGAWQEFSSNNGANSVQIIERFVPMVAREVGRQWETDELSFAQVSIASARIQELVRQSSDIYLGVGKTAPTKPATKAFFVVPRSEDHSIGGIIAARHAQQLGLGVFLSIGQSPAEIVAEIRNSGTSLVGISVASKKALGPASDLVKAIHDQVPGSSVVVGGNVLSLVEDIGAESEADLATNDVERAVAFFRGRSEQAALQAPRNEN